MHMRHLLVVVAVVAGLSACALSVEVPRMEVVELSERAIVVRLADAPSPNQTLAVATSSGIIVVDSQPTPTLAQECRRLIVEHFGRDDFTHLILTHDDLDHICGTAAFPDVAIVAQQACYTVIRDILRNVPAAAANLIPWYANTIAAHKAELAALDATSGAADALRAEIAGYEVMLADLRAGVWAPRLPTQTFTEMWTLDAGDTTVTCWFLGPGHSQSDILVHFEAEGILAVGDAISKHYLCVGVDPELARSIDVEHWCRALDQVLEKDFDQVVWGHRGFLSRDDVANRAGYISALWESILDLKADGVSLADAHSSLAVAGLFPNFPLLLSEMAVLLGATEEAVAVEAERQHAANIDLFWSVAP